MQYPEHVFQQQIDTASANGGGVVTIPAGHYDCGSLQLKANVELHLEAGAVLQLCADKTRWAHDDGGASVIDHASYLTSEYNGRPKDRFIWADHADNITITGSGVIDGNEDIFHGDVSVDHIEGTYYPRTPLVLLTGCHHVTVSGVTLQHSAYWTLHLTGCVDVDIHDMRIQNNMHMANCDGIDPDHCQDVRIRGCQITGGDDSIVLKATSAASAYGPTQNVLVSDCILQSASAAIKIGTESVSDFKHIRFNNCVIKDSNRGISLQLRDGGNIEDVSFTGMSIATTCYSEKWWGNGEPIAVTMFDRDDATTAGTIQNIQFKDITATGQNGIFMAAEHPGAIKGVRFDNVQVNVVKTGTYHPAGFDYRPSKRSPYKSEGSLATYHAENVQGVTARDCHVQVANGVDVATVAIG